jgi:hypothetical protein
MGRREIASVRQLQRLPKSPITLCGPGTYILTREKKLKALDCYLKLIKYLLPDDRAIASPTLWHSDLHVANIFVDPNDPTKIVSLIDWQSTEIAPLYFQARRPYVLDYDGPAVNGIERPEPPKDYDSLEPEAQKRADKLWLQQGLCYAYNLWVHRHNPRLYSAFEFQHTSSHDLLLLARNLLIDGEATYLSQIAALESTWDSLPGAKGAPYPFSFSAKEREEMEADVEGAVLGIQVMRAIREAIGELFPDQGIVAPEKYEESLNALSQMKEQVMADFAKTEHEKDVWEKMWPFGT